MTTPRYTKKDEEMARFILTTALLGGAIFLLATAIHLLVEALTALFLVIGSALLVAIFLALLLGCYWRLRAVLSALLRRGRRQEVLERQFGLTREEYRQLRAAARPERRRP